MKKTKLGCCTVDKCRHNENGCECKLGSIEVKCGCEDCTCCGSYEEE